MPRNRVQNALRQRKQDEASANQATGQTQEKAYDCFFHHDDLPSPMENGTLCTLPLKQLDGFPGHEEHFPLYTGQRLDDMVDSIRRLGVQTPILVWKTSNGRYIIISGHNRVNASVLAGRTTIPAVVRTDLTMETAEDLFFEMNFRQRSLAEMLFSQRVLCVAAHYNMMKRQGRRTDLLTAAETSPDTQEKSDTGDPATSPDTQEKSHTDEKIAQEYELTRDKVSKYCRYLVVVARNEAISLLRKRHQEIPFDDDVMGEKYAFEHDSTKDIIETILEMPETYRAVLEMRFIEDRSTKEIATALGLKETTVDVRIHRGRALLIKKLREEGYVR